MDMAAVESLSHDQLVKIIKSDIRCADELTETNNNEIKKAELNQDSESIQEEFPIAQSSKNYCHSVCSLLISSSDDVMETSTISNMTTATTTDDDDVLVQSVRNNISNNNKILQETQNKAMTVSHDNNSEQQKFTSSKNYLNNNKTIETTTKTLQEAGKIKTRDELPTNKNGVLQKYNLKSERNQKPKLKLNDNKVSVSSSYVVVGNMDNNDDDQRPSSSASDAEMLALKSGASTVSSQSSCHENRNPIQTSRSFLTNSAMRSELRSTIGFGNCGSMSTKNVLSTTNNDKRSRFIFSNLLYERNYSPNRRTNSINTSNKTFSNYNSINNNNYTSRLSTNQKLNSHKGNLGDNFNYYKRIAETKQKN